MRGGPASPAGQAAAAAVVALSRVVRTLALHDPRNATVQRALDEYGDRMRAALEGFGDLDLQVRPFELLVAGEVVYQEADRERSLAFRMFRDGVRRLVIAHDAPWDELVRLLEILTVRFTGVAQLEADVVTLLREAGLRAVRVHAVEGFTAADLTPELEGEGSARSRALRAELPPGWDTPVRKLPAPGPLAWIPVRDEQLAALRHEAAEVDELALSVARDLLSESVRAGWPSPNSDLVAFFAELRDALISEGKLAMLKYLVDLIGEAAFGELREAMLREIGDARTLDLVLASVPPGSRELPRELVAFLPLLGIEPTLDRLQSEQLEPMRRLLLGIVGARLPRAAPAVIARLPRLAPALGLELARAVVARAPERAVEVARYLLGRPEESLRVEALATLETTAAEVPLRPLHDLLRDRSPAIRVRAAAVLARRGDGSSFQALRDVLEHGPGVTTADAAAMGEALASVAPIPAARLLAEWSRPRGGFLRRPSARQRLLQWAAVAGIAALPGDGVEVELRALADASDAELRRHCLAALERRRGGGDAAK
jgi:hypothetical protein